jgi:hypothetical protein
MEYKTISTKITSEELSLFKNHCKVKGISPSKLLSDLLKEEMKIPFPHTIAGNNLIEYNKEKDTYSWTILLDTGEKIKITDNLSPKFIEELHVKFNFVIDQRNTTLRKKNKNSVEIPSNIVRNKK